MMRLYLDNTSGNSVKSGGEGEVRSCLINPSPVITNSVDSTESSPYCKVCKMVIGCGSGYLHFSIRVLHVLGAKLCNNLDLGL